MDNIKLVLQEIGLEGVDWIGLDQLVTSCSSSLFILYWIFRSHNIRKFLTSWGTTSVAVKSILHEVSYLKGPVEISFSEQLKTNVTRSTEPQWLKEFCTDITGMYTERVRVRHVLNSYAVDRNF